MYKLWIQNIDVKTRLRFLSYCYEKGFHAKLKEDGSLFFMILDERVNILDVFFPQKNGYYVPTNELKIHSLYNLTSDFCFGKPQGIGSLSI